MASGNVNKLMIPLKYLVSYDKDVVLLATCFKRATSSSGLSILESQKPISSLHKRHEKVGSIAELPQYSITS